MAGVFGICKEGFLAKTGIRQEDGERCVLVGDTQDIAYALVGDS